MSDAIRDKVAAKVEKLARLFERLTAIEVMVDLKDDPSASVELLVSAEHKHDFVAAAEASSVLAALDGAIHKIEGQLRKYKEKVQDHHRAPAGQEAPVAPEAEDQAE